MRNPDSIPRKPGGAPGAGQFDTGAAHAEPDIQALQPAATDGVTDSERLWRLDEVLSMVGKSSYFHGKRVGASLEDLKSEVSLRFFEQMNREGVKPRTFEGPGAPINVRNPSAYIDSIARAEAATTLRRLGEVGKRDQRAITEMRGREDEFRANNQRSMTSAERHDLAEQIRADTPVSDRPRVDFHLYADMPELASTSDQDDSYGYEIGSTSLSDVSTKKTSRSTLRAAIKKDADADLDAGNYQENGAAAIRAIRDIGGKAGEAEAIRRAWNMAAEASHGTPLVQEGSVGERSARRLRLVVAKAGGATVLARRYNQAETTPEEESALFAPFGADLDADDEDAVVSTILRYPDRGDRLWDAAVSGATAARVRRAVAV